MQFALQAELVQVAPAGQQPGSGAGDEQCGDMVSMAYLSTSISKSAESVACGCC